MIGPQIFLQNLLLNSQYQFQYNTDDIRPMSDNDKDKVEQLVNLKYLMGTNY